MKRIKNNGKYVSRGYFYGKYEIRNHGYYPPDGCIWWEAINTATGEADFHAHRKIDIKLMIDKSN